MSASSCARPISPAPRGCASWRVLLALAVGVAGILIAFSSGYGYHRDELYFLAAGRHLAWAYPDQGLLTPLLAHIADLVAPGSLAVLRLPSALMAAGCVWITGLIVRELGGRTRAQLIGASCTAVASVVLVVGHLLSTSSFDLLAWTLVTWLVARMIRTGDGRLWLAIGAVAGLGLLNKPLIVALVACLIAGLAVAGPRELLRSRWLVLGAAFALALWAPWLLWQAGHGWPQFTVSSAIAHGGSASAQPRWAFLPFQLLLVSPLLAPVWIAGLVALVRSRWRRPFRCLGLAWIALAAVFLVTGGKPYYLAGMFPILLGAGALEVDAWLDSGRPLLRRGALLGALVVSGLVSAVIALPVLAGDQLGVVIAMNSDIGETVGWPQLTQQVAAVYRRAPSAVIFTANYGEAGAVDRFGSRLGLPSAYSGHNGFAQWGPPPDADRPVVVVGLRPAVAAANFRGCRKTARIGNTFGIHNEEWGKTIELCAGPRRPWSELWPGLAHLS